MDITIKKHGDPIPTVPLTGSNGLIVNKGDQLDIALAPQWFNQVTQFTNLITWQWRQMKGDGSFTPWVQFGSDEQGTQFTDSGLTSIGGIYQIAAVISSGTYQYVRAVTDPTGVDSNGNANPIYQQGQPDCVGVVDQQWEMDVVHQARTLLTSTTYAEAGSILPIYSGGPTFAGRDKCKGLRGVTS